MYRSRDNLFAAGGARPGRTDRDKSDLRERVPPSADIAPFVAGSHALNVRLLFDQGVVETDFRQRGELLEEVEGVRVGNHFVRFFQHVSNPVSENAAVPQRTQRDTFLRGYVSGFSLNSLMWFKSVPGSSGKQYDV